MFDQLFARSDTVARYLSAPLVDERREYLTHGAVQGMTKSTLEAKARLLLSIAEYLRLAYRPRDIRVSAGHSDLDFVTPKNSALGR